MPMFPAFIDLKGKNCIVIGGGKVAARKIDTLMKFGARIAVVSPEITDKIQKLKYEDKVVVIRKAYSSEDLENAYLAIAATNNASVNGKVHEDAVKRGILVNVADAPEKCTFVFPAVVVRDDLVIGITTSGSFPTLSKRVREKVEAAFPEFYGDIISNLKKWRLKAERDIEDSKARQEFMNKILDEVLFYENAVTDTQLNVRINNIFEEYKHERNY